MNLPDLLTGTTISWPNALLAVVVLIVSWVMWRVTRKTSYRLLGGLRGISEHIRLIGSRIAGYLVLLTGIGITLTILGAPLQPVLTVVLLVAAVLVLALRGIATNFAAGIVIQTRQPIHLGDLIEAAGYLGTVRELNGRSIILQTNAGRTIHIPNATVLNDPIINHTTNGAVRSDIEIRATGARHIDDITTLLETITAAIPGVHTQPAPYVRVTSIEPDRITALLRFWHDPPTTRKITAQVIAATAAALRDAGRTATVTGPPPPAAFTPPPAI